MPSPMPADAPQTIAVRPLSSRSTAAERSWRALCACYLCVRTETTSRTAAAEARSALLLGREAELDDLLDAGRTELHRNAHVQAADAVLALQQAVQEDALLVEQDRVHHLRRCGAGCVPRGRAEQVDDLAAADAGALDELRDPRLRRQLRERHAAHGGRRDDGDHLVAVAAEHHGLDVLDRRPRLPGDERPEAGGVEDARHADDALAGAWKRLWPWHIASSGFETTTTVALGECFTASFVTAATIASFVVTRSSRLIPGARGLPAVTTMTSSPWSPRSRWHR